MRRPLHCLLVAVLIFSLSFDIARACGHMRRAHRVHAVYGCPPAPACYGGWSMAVVVADVAVGCGSFVDPCLQPMISGHVRFSAGSFVEEVPCGTVVECCGGPATHVVPGAVIAEQPVMATEAAPIVAAPARPPATETPAVVAETIAPKTPQAAEAVHVPEPIKTVPAGTGDQSVVSVAEPQPVKPLPPAEAVLPASADAPVEPLIPEPATPARDQLVERAKEDATADQNPAEPLVAEPLVAEPLVAEPLVAEPLVAEPLVAEPAVAEPAVAEPAVAEPALQPAGDVTNAPPAAAPEPQPPTAPPAREEVKAEAALPVATEEPAEPNLFEEVEATPVPPATAKVSEPAPVEPPAALADEATAAPDPAADNAGTAADAAAEPAQNEPAADAAAQPEVTADDTPPAAQEEPAANEALEEQAPATDSSTAPFSSTEPARRWIDATGRFAVVGTLVTVREDTAEIRKADGRTVSVRLDRLSPHDRGYAEQSADRRLAGQATPRPTDTAGM